MVESEKISTIDTKIQKFSESSLGAKNNSPNRIENLKNTRTEFLKLWWERKNRRESIKQQQEYENQKISERWKEEQIKAQKEKIQNFFNRLNKIPEKNATEKLKSQILSKIQKNNQNYARIKSQQEKMRKNRSCSPRLRKIKQFHEEKNRQNLAERQKILENLTKNYEIKEMKIKKAQNELKIKRSIKKERVEKKILRAKIYKAVNDEIKHNCDRNKRDLERWNTISKLFPSFNKKLEPLEPVIKSPIEQLKESITVEDFEKIKDDIGYFLPPSNEPDDEILDLFEKIEQKFNPKSAKRTINFANKRPYISRNSDLSLGKIKKYKTVDIKIHKTNFEELHRKQEENLWYETKKENIQREIILHKINEKNKLAKSGVDSIMKRRIGNIAKLGKTESLYIKNGLLKRYFITDFISKKV